MKRVTVIPVVVGAIGADSTELDVCMHFFYMYNVHMYMCICVYMCVYVNVYIDISTRRLRLQKTIVYQTFSTKSS